MKDLDHIIEYKQAKIFTNKGKIDKSILLLNKLIASLKNSHMGLPAYN